MTTPTDLPVTVASAITELDQSLSVFRKSWMEAAAAEKPRWWNIINKALDERLALMALR